MAKHLWVEMKVTAVEVEIAEDNPENLNVFVQPNQEQFASEDAEIGCWVCGYKPTPHNLDDECPGDTRNSSSNSEQAHE